MAIFIGLFLLLYITDKNPGERRLSLRLGDGWWPGFSNLSRIYQCIGKPEHYVNNASIERRDANDRRQQENAAVFTTLLCGILPSRLPVATLPHVGPPFHPPSSCFVPLIILPCARARLPDPRIRPKAFPLAIQPRRRYIRRMCIILNNPYMPLCCIMTDVDSKRAERAGYDR